MELADNFHRAEELYASGQSKLNDDNFDGAINDLKKAHEFYMLASKETPDNVRVWIGLVKTLPFIADDEPEDITRGTLSAYRDIAIQKAEDADELNEIQRAYDEAASLTGNSESESESSSSRIKFSPHALTFGIAGVIMISVIGIILAMTWPKKIQTKNLPPVRHVEVKQPEPLDITVNVPKLKRSDLDRMNPLKTQTKQSTNEKSIRGTRINIRSSPNLNAGIITRLNEGNHVTVLDERGEWSMIRMGNGQTGWLVSKYLQDRVTSWASHGGTEMKINGMKVNVRSSASTRSRIITQLNDGDLVEITDRRSVWCYVYALEGSEGWVHGDYVRQ